MAKVRTSRPRSRSRNQSESLPSLLPPHFTPKLLLLHAKSSSPLFSSLSHNILREICAYLNIPLRPYLGICINHKVSIFEVDSLHWNKLEPELSPPTVWSYTYHLVLISAFQVFLCGGYFSGDS